MTAAPTLPVPAARLSPVGAEVFRGLTSARKSLCPWLFYDERGSELFEQITELPEYYPTRTERSILAAYAEEIIARAAGPDRHDHLTVLELGAGTASKTGLLLAAAVRHQGRVEYFPIDVSPSALHEAKEHLERELPGVHVLPRVADYTEGLGLERRDAAERRLVLYIGSSIGNFDPEEARALLHGVRAQLAPGDTLLLGADQVPGPAKPVSTLEAAYSDAAGVTAAFNLNVLTRINRELRADFVLDCFRHRAFWNGSQSRIEMHLVSQAQQVVSIPELDLSIRFEAGETIHTESSYKFTDAEVERLLGGAGFALSSTWKDSKGCFGVYLAVAA